MKMIIGRCMKHSKERRRFVDSNSIILPGDPLWDEKKAEEVSPSSKLPDELLETAFQEVYEEVKDKIEIEKEKENGPLSSAGGVPEKPPIEKAPGVSFKYCSPSQKRSFDIPMEKEIEAKLTEDLPLSWERKCFANKLFRKDCLITLNSCTLFPGVGILYGFKEGMRGGYGVRPDQISIIPPEAEKKDTENGTLDAGQAVGLQQARQTDQPE